MLFDFPRLPNCNATGSIHYNISGRVARDLHTCSPTANKYFLIIHVDTPRVAFTLNSTGDMLQSATATLDNASIMASIYTT